MYNKIERIEVKNLFGKYCYDLDLRNGESIAILFGANGCGKTTIFNIVDFIFHPSFKKFDQIEATPFLSVTCHLSSGKSIRLEKKLYRGEDYRRNVIERSEMKLKIFKTDDESSSTSRSISAWRYDQDSLHLNSDARFTGDVIDMSYDDSYSSYDDYDDYDDFNMKSIYNLDPIIWEKEFVNKIRKFEKDNDCFIYTKYIKADRLHKTFLNSEQLLDDDPLREIQEETEEMISEMDIIYKNLVSNAKDELPKKFLDSNDVPQEEFEEFEIRWKQYVSDINKYYEIGFLDSSKTIIEEEELFEAFNKYPSFLSVYLDVFIPILDPLKEEYEKLSLLIKILNKRVSNKVYKFNSKGLIVLVDGEEIPLSALSSGEKNDLIMFYNLIVKPEPGALILIDEPEISLHIEWQEKYLDCLLEVCEKKELNAIVATHSPNIINGHFELYAVRGFNK